MSEENPNPGIPGLPVSADTSQGEMKTVVYHMQKSNLFRVVHCDGVWTSTSGVGNVQLMFFNERLPIPTEVTYSLNGWIPGEEQLDRRVVKEGMIREIEVSVSLPVHVLSSLRNWLNGYFEGRLPNSDNAS